MNEIELVTKDLNEFKELKIIIKKWEETVRKSSTPDAIDFLSSVVNNNKITDSSVKLFLNIVIAQSVNSIINDNVANKSLASKTTTYIIFNNLTGLYKIGKTKKTTQERMSQLSGGSGGTNYIAIEIDGDVELELHKKFQDLRLKGEWFSLTNDDIISIKNIYGTNH